MFSPRQDPDLDDGPGAQLMPVSGHAKGSARRSPTFDSPDKFLHAGPCCPYVVEVLAVDDLPPKILLSKDRYGPASTQEDACGGDDPLARGSEEDEEVERTESRVHALPGLQGLSTPSSAHAIDASIRSGNPDVAAIVVTRTVHGTSIGHPAASVPRTVAAMCVQVLGPEAPANRDTTSATVAACPRERVPDAGARTPSR